MNKFKAWLIHKLGGYTEDEKILCDMDSTKTVLIQTVSATRTITCFYTNIELERIQESIRTELSRSLPIQFTIKEGSGLTVAVTGQTDIIHK